MDTPHFCHDKHHFHQYPHKIQYRYNSRGFRDEEWPDDLDSLQQAIWCLGDSFTVGIGQPLDHIWPKLLSKVTNRRTINVSMDGASNDWIARRARQILDTVNPVHMVIMWTYLHRRESPDTNLSDEDRRRHHDWKSLTTNDDFQNFADCKQKITGFHTRIVQTAIPNQKADIQKMWDDIKGPDWPVLAPESSEQFNSLPSAILQEIHHLHQYGDLLRYHYEYLHLFQDVRLIPYLDRARDGHHFDILTSQYVVDLVLPLVA